MSTTARCYIRDRDRFLPHIINYTKTRGKSFRATRGNSGCFAADESVYAYIYMYIRVGLPFAPTLDPLLIIEIVLPTLFRPQINDWVLSGSPHNASPEGGGPGVYVYSYSTRTPGYPRARPARPVVWRASPSVITFSVTSQEDKKEEDVIITAANLSAPLQDHSIVDFTWTGLYSELPLHTCTCDLRHRCATCWRGYGEIGGVRMCWRGQG